MNPVRLPSLAALILLLCLPVQAAWADVVTVRSGIGTAWQRNRDTNENTRYASLLTEVSYRSPTVELSLDMPLRWNAEKWELDRDIWSREGDPLRPVKTFLYRSPTGLWEAGLELLHSWTPGQGYLVRGLSGAGETDYALPGFRFRWAGERTRIEAGVDRPVDPTVQAVAISYRLSDRVLLNLEGALDPGAPLSFAGTFENGRPKTDDTDPVAGSAAGLELVLREGRSMDISGGGHVGKLGDGAEGVGGDLSVSVDFSSYYRNRLQVKVASIQCRGGYVPAWFDGIYPVQRWGVDGQPLLALYPLDGTAPDRQLDSMEIRYDLGELFSLKGGIERFDDNSMSRARFDIGLREESGRGLEATIMSRVDGPDGVLFAVDSNLYSSASALYDLSPHLLLKLTFTHSWAFDEELAGLDPLDPLAGLVPLNSAVLGLMYGISF
ncbi:MAG: hypothetical protein P1S46_07865 [bacterium]|nr:hypothetical protein [bacterium]